MENKDYIQNSDAAKQFKIIGGAGDDGNQDAKNERPVDENEGDASPNDNAPLNDNEDGADGRNVDDDNNNQPAEQDITQDNDDNEDAQDEDEGEDEDEDEDENEDEQDEDEGENENEDEEERNEEGGGTYINSLFVTYLMTKMYKTTHEDNVNHYANPKNGSRWVFYSGSPVIRLFFRDAVPDLVSNGFGYDYIDKVYLLELAYGADLEQAKMADLIACKTLMLFHNLMKQSVGESENIEMDMICYLLKTHNADFLSITGKPPFSDEQVSYFLMKNIDYNGFIYTTHFTSNNKNINREHSTSRIYLPSLSTMKFLDAINLSDFHTPNPKILNDTKTNKKWFKNELSNVLKSFFLVNVNNS